MIPPGGMKNVTRTAATRTSVESTSRYSASPPQTPARTRSVCERTYRSDRELSEGIATGIRLGLESVAGDSHRHFTDLSKLFK